MAADNQSRDIFQAAAANDVATLRELVAAATNLEVRDGNGRTPLLVATRSRAVDAAAFLIESGADVNAKDNIEDSPYLYAGAEGPREILLLTLKHGADLQAVNRYGGTALIPAAHHGHLDIVSDLVKTDIDIDHVNYLGWTALFVAVILGDGGPLHTEIVRVLVCAGADRNIADNQGKTPLDHARNSGYGAMISILTTTAESSNETC